jgi:hypothetical protein
MRAFALRHKLAESGYWGAKKSCMIDYPNYNKTRIKSRDINEKLDFGVNLVKKIHKSNSVFPQSLLKLFKKKQLISISF